MLRTAVSATIALGVISGSASARVIYVDADAPGDNIGTDWDNAYRDLQLALQEAVTGDEIWVASGTYTPGGPGEELASFQLKDGVAIYGGFAGGETARIDRDWSVNETILSGDVGRDDVVGSGSNWYLNWARNTPNSAHVVDGSGVDRSAVLDGVTVADGATGPNGTPAGSWEMFGSGLFCLEGSPTIRNVTFKHNLCAFASGGAAYVLDGSPSFRDCMFLENYAHDGHGAGLFVYGSLAPEVEDCVFQYNIAVGGTTEASGGGYAYRANAPVTVRRCVFISNTVRPFYSISDKTGWGGGLWNWNAPMTVVDCEFRTNTANIGGGFHTWGPATVANSLFVGNKALEHPNDPYPDVGGYGGGISAYSATPNQTFVINCDVVENRAEKMAGVFGGWNEAVWVQNSIVWGNIATNPEFAGQPRAQIGGNFEAEYSCIQQIFDPPEPGEDPPDPSNYPGCVDSDPMFVGGGDYHVQPGSPVIDAGDTSALPVFLVTDFDGLPRRADDPTVADTGVGPAPIVDMGMYEVPGATCAADWNGDGFVNTSDFVGYLNDYAAASNGQPTVYGDPDLAPPLGIVNTSDFLEFLNLYTAGCP